MNFSLKTKLSLAFILVAMILILSLGIIINVTLDRHFREYITQKQEKRNNETVELISQQFVDENMWRVEVIENIGVSALEQGLILKVTDVAGKTIWDATEHNHGLCQQMIEHMSQNMASRYPNWKGKYTVDKYPIMNNQSHVGFVEIGYYGPFYLNDDDLYFINTVNVVLVWVTLIALFISLIAGSIISNRLATPIARVIRTARLIEKGNYKEKVIEKSTTKEINELTTTINSLAKALETQEELRKRLTGDVAHELRTPMATLQSHIEAMLDGIWEPTNERLKSCYEEVIRINKMVGDLHLLAKYEVDNLALTKSHFNIDQLIGNLIMNFQNQFMGKGIEIIFQGNNSTIFADRDKISQVLINLISNSLKYTPAGGRVEICTKDVKNGIEIIVEDNGEGISETDLPYVFERFYRADQSRNRLTGGSGIGLTIVRAIVEAHKGTIEVQSTVSVGTGFIIFLPKQ